MGSKRAAMVGLQGLWEVCPELESCGAFAQKLCAGTFPAETVPAEDCWTGGATFDATSSDDDDDNYSTIFEEDFDEDQEVNSFRFLIHSLCNFGDICIQFL